MYSQFGRNWFQSSFTCQRCSSTRTRLVIINSCVVYVSAGAEGYLTVWRAFFCCKTSVLIIIAVSSLEGYVSCLQFDFGCEGSYGEGAVISDVKLPPWAESAHEFVRINREVSQRSGKCNQLLLHLHVEIYNMLAVNCILVWPSADVWSRLWSQSMCQPTCTTGSISSLATSREVSWLSSLSVRCITL